MSRLGIDAAWGINSISPAALRSVGADVLVGYVSSDRSKNLSIEQAKRVHDAKIDIVLVWETTAHRARAGGEGGHTDAIEATHQADAIANALGIPKWPVIHFAPFDDDAAEADQGAINSYFHGAASVRGRGGTGGYLGYWPLKRALEQGVPIDVPWQTYAWSGGNLHPAAALYQFSNGHRVAGVGCDYDHVIRTNFGQITHPDKPKPPPDPYALYPTGPVFTFVLGKNTVHWSERTLAAHVDGALHDTKRFRNFLKGQLLKPAQAMRYRCYMFAAYQPPDFKRKRSHNYWTTNNRGVRWQRWNARVKAIERIP